MVTENSSRVIVMLEATWKALMVVMKVEERVMVKQFLKARGGFGGCLGGVGGSNDCNERTFGGHGHGGSGWRK